MDQRSKSKNTTKNTNGMQSSPIFKPEVSQEKANPNSLRQAVRYLNKLIDDGIEFPEAHWRVSQVFTQVDEVDLFDAYDNQEFGEY